MIMGFWQLVILVGVLLAFALAIIIPFVWYLHKKAGHDRDQTESCHNFQRELNRQTLLGFNKNSEALNLNTQVLNTFMERMGAATTASSADKPKGS